MSASINSRRVLVALLGLVGCSEQSSTPAEPGPRSDSPIAAKAAKDHEATVGTRAGCTDCHVSLAPSVAPDTVAQFEVKSFWTNTEDHTVLRADGTARRERLEWGRQADHERTAWQGVLVDEAMWTWSVERALESGYFFRAQRSVSALNACTHVGEIWLAVELADGRRSVVGTSCFGVTEPSDVLMHPGFWWAFDGVQFALRAVSWDSPTQVDGPFAWEAR